MQQNTGTSSSFCVKDSISDYETVLSESDVDSFIISSIKIRAVEIYKMLKGITRIIYHIYYACNISAVSLTRFRLRWQSKSARDSAERERAKQITHSDGSVSRLQYLTHRKVNTKL